MIPILIEGTKLLVFGMGVVLIYLVLMIGCINLISMLFRKSSQEEEKALQLAQSSHTSTSSNTEAEPTELVAVITAAIVAHKNKLLK